MLAFDRTTIGAGANERISPRLRYLAQRWAELLDDHGYFARSAATFVDPVTAVRDFFNAGQEFLESPDFRYPSMLAAFKTTRNLITLERNLHAWFHEERAGALAALKRVEPVRGQDQIARRRHVVRRTRGALQGELLAFRTALEDPTRGYRAKLMSAVCRSSPRTDEQWRAFDENLCYLAAVVLSEGRGGKLLALETARAFRDATDDAAALREFCALVTPSDHQFGVAVLLTGVQSLHRDVVQLGYKPISETEPSWEGQTPQGDSQLKAFIDAPSGTTNTCAVHIEVAALDPVHARRLARARAEELLDRLAAEHRVGRFDLRPEALVRDASRGRTTLVKDDEIGIRLARAHMKAGGPELRRSLRFHRLACNSSAPVLGVAQSWIALEHLARGASLTVKKSSTRREVKPAVFLPTHIAAVASLAAARHAVLDSWHTTRRGCANLAAARWTQVEEWLHVRSGGKAVDQDRWLELLAAEPDATAPRKLSADAPAAEAAAFLFTIASQASPFVERRLADVASLVRQPARMIFFMSRAEARVADTVNRIHLMRHRTVHGALMHDESAHQLAASAHHVLDAIYEVVPHWLDSCDAPWEAFDRARAWNEELKREWGRSYGPLATPLAQFVAGPERAQNEGSALTGASDPASKR